MRLSTRLTIGFACLALASAAIVAQERVGEIFRLGAAGVTLTHDGDGALTITGLGDGADEALTLNLDDTANVADVTSSTGVTEVQFTSIGLDAASYAVAGAAGGTGSSCSAFTGGICTTASDAPSPEVAALWAEIERLKAEIAALRAR